MIYAYARVSTKEQNLDRQLAEFEKYEIDKIYKEKQSGKDFNSREVYQSMKKKLKEGDLLYILSIDRLGRNYEQILNEWRELTEKKRVDIKVLDMPVLDTQNQVGEGLDGRFVSNLVLQILAYVSEKERTKIRERQEQGIRIAKEKGVKFGRPKAQLPENAEEIIKRYANFELTAFEAAKELGISKETFFKLLKPDEKKNRVSNHDKYLCYMKNGDVIKGSLVKISKELFVCDSTVRNFMKGKKMRTMENVEKIEKIGA